MRTLVRISACLAFASVPPLAAQQVLTFPDAIELAQRQGYQARAARAGLDAARYRFSSSRSELLPQLSLSGVLPLYNRSISPVVQPDGSTLFRAQQETRTALTATLSQRVPLTGGTFFVSSALSRFAVSGPQQYETWSSAPVVVGLQQDILKPNVAEWNRKVASARIEVDERLYREAKEEIALATTDLYFAAYAAQVALDNAIKNAAVNDTLYTLNQGRFEVGKIGENDLLQSELALLRARTVLDGARLDHERAIDALRVGLALPSGTAFVVAATAEVPTFEADTARAVAEALKNRAAVSEVDLQDVQARQGIAEARWADGIGATVVATLGLNATAPEANLVYRDLLERRSLQVAVELPLWQWGARSESVAAARAERERAGTLAEASLQEVAHQARFAALELGQARRSLALSAAADTVAGKRYEVAYNRYVIGRITLDNLFIAQNEKDQALTRYVTALRDYWRAYYGLRRATLFDFRTGQPIR